MRIAIALGVHLREKHLLRVLVVVRDNLRLKHGRELVVLLVLGRWVLRDVTLAMLELALAGGGGELLTTGRAPVAYRERMCLSNDRCIFAL